MAAIHVCIFFQLIVHTMESTPLCVVFMWQCITVSAVIYPLVNVCLHVFTCPVTCMYMHMHMYMYMHVQLQ